MRRRGASGVARARLGGPLGARAAVAWAVPATSGTGVWGPERPISRAKGRGDVRWSNGGEGERGGTRCGQLRRRHASATCRPWRAKPGAQSPVPLLLQIRPIRRSRGAPDDQRGSGGRGEASTRWITHEFVGLISGLGRIRGEQGWCMPPVRHNA